MRSLSTSFVRGTSSLSGALSSVDFPICAAADSIFTIVIGGAVIAPVEVSEIVSEELVDGSIFTISSASPSSIISIEKPSSS